MPDLGKLALRSLAFLLIAFSILAAVNVPRNIEEAVRKEALVIYVCAIVAFASAVWLIHIAAL